MQEALGRAKLACLLPQAGRCSRGSARHPGCSHPGSRSRQLRPSTGPGARVLHSSYSLQVGGATAGLLRPLEADALEQSAGSFHLIDWIDCPSSMHSMLDIAMRARDAEHTNGRVAEQKNGMMVWG